ncbi:hypothetical protein GGTG_07769 [Gaeumannomyces tritici R3-111a-1]|uniref:Glucose-6-phosphate 1-epimerase n=1 Tax=Gaeumannomyces tritici (strain R3-111a-1) TaxID=644352 RepID=J3P2M3_GAET3|nr:hypothetical protein GGTG_07769 [Gaeumannomyces tritici R3-111a-1]EJT73915.1 hypothetical protein GGTG_07769 [Gaeumannomyces tritici R3-111a-1]
MVDRPNKPSALASTPGLAPQAQVTISDDKQRVSAVLPTGESVEVLLYGATVLSWKRNGQEKLWLSEAASLDGTKAVRGGIPLVFPVFGTAPDHAETSKLPQHGFARTSHWEFLGKSTSESQRAGGGGASSSLGAATGDHSVKLDFGLTSSNLAAATRALWPHPFNLLYSVTLERDSLTTSLTATNAGDKPIEIQVLLHTYLRINDIKSVSISGLDGAEFVDKVAANAVSKQAEGGLSITGETDRIYTPAGGPRAPVAVSEGGRKVFEVVRDNLDDVVVWNPWDAKAESIGDFAPKDGYHKMLCVEAGAVRGWQTLEPGDALEGAQTITAW